MDKEQINYRITFFASAIIFIGLFSMTIYTPSLPDITSSLATSRAMVKMAITGYLFAYGVGQLFYGPVSDRLGRKNIIIFALLVLSMGHVMAALASSGFMFVCSQIISGLGAGCGSTLSRAIVHDTHHEHQFARSLSIVMFTAILSTNIAPIFGGFIQSYSSWQAIFWCTALISLSIMVSIVFLFPETIPERQHLPIKDIMSHYFQLIRHRFFIAHAFIIALIFSVATSYYAMTPFLFQINLHLSPLSNGLLMIGPVLSIFLGMSAFNLCLTYRVADRLIMQWGIALYLLGSISLLAFGLLGIMSLMVIVVPSLLMFFAAGFINPIFTTNGISMFDKNIGQVSGLQGAIKVFGAAITGAVVARMPDHNQVSLAIIEVVLSILILLNYLWAYPLRKTSLKQDIF